MKLRSGIKTKIKKNKDLRYLATPSHLAKKEPMEVVDNEVSFHFKITDQQDEVKGADAQWSNGT